LAKIKKGSEYLFGKEIRVLIDDGKNPHTLVSTLKNLYCEIVVSKNIFELLREDRSAVFTDFLNFDIVSGIEKFSDNFNRQLLGDGALSNELTGLVALFDSRDLYGCKRSLICKPKFYKFCHSCADNQMPIYNVLCDVLNHNRQDVDFIYCSPKMMLIYMRDYYGVKNVNCLNVKDGYMACLHNGISIISNENCPDDKIYLLNSADFYLHQLGDWRPLEQNDGAIFRSINHTQYKITLVKYADLICHAPHKQARIQLCREDDINLEKD
jgi:hypothetical protein